MSQSSVSTTPKEPKGFLRKGEGLKRFAAYKPPLPVSTNKVQRRQTYVKFKADFKSKNINFVYPDLPLDDSVNLSTEIPKIAPPKIMHTPVRPNRQALGTLATPNLNTFTNRTSLFFKDFETPREKNFSRKVTFMPSVESPKASTDVFKRPATPSPENTPVTQEDNSPIDEATIKSPPKRYNLRGTRKTAILSTAPAKETKKSRRPVKAIVERHITPPPPQSLDSSPERTAQLDNLMNKIQKKKDELSCESENEDQVAIPDLPPPSPNSCISALGMQIVRIESALNELKREKEYCTCGASTNSRATRKASRTKSTKDSDSDCSTPKSLGALVEEVALLRSKFDEIKLRR